MKRLDIILFVLCVLALAALMLPFLLPFHDVDPDDDGLLEFDIESIGIEADAPQQPVKQPVKP